MLTSVWVNKLSTAILGTAFITFGTISANPANAINFKFEGSFNDDTLIKGKASLNTEFLNSLVQRCFNGLELICNEREFFDPSGSYSLTVGEKSLSSSSGLTVSPFVALNTPWAELGRGFVTLIGDYQLSINPDGCLAGSTCEGILFGPRSDGNLDLAFIPVTTENPESVPEPTATLSLSVVGALILMRKGKIFLANTGINSNKY